MVTRGGLTVLLVASLSCAAPRRGAPTDQKSASRAPVAAPAAPPPGAVPQDLDGDGKPDAWTVSTGQPGREVRLYDLDGDGGPDVSLSFEGGRLVQVELLHAVESIPAAVSRFEGGRLVAPPPDPARGGAAGVEAAPAQK